MRKKSFRFFKRNFYSLIQGYIGYMPSQSAIYVVFRGSTSISDWANNLDAILTTYPRCSGCEVHKGFYKAQQGVIAYVTQSVQALKAKYPSYSVIVTGHSLGIKHNVYTVYFLWVESCGCLYFLSRQFTTPFSCYNTPCFCLCFRRCCYGDLDCN